MAAVTGTIEMEVGHRSDKLTPLPLVALVVDSMIGGGDSTPCRGFARNFPPLVVVFVLAMLRFPPMVAGCR
jgi:hypothetical protein